MDTAASITVSELAKPVQPVAPELSIGEVAELFISESNRDLLSLPVTRGTTPVGVVSRYEVMHIFVRMFGRELQGRRPISTIMNNKPLIVEENQSIAATSQYLTANIRFPVTEDFIVVRDGQYRGTGIVADVLKAMEQQLSGRTLQLASAYDQLKQSQTQLVQSEKMASLGQMVAGVAHEINTPLGYVRNNVELLRDLITQFFELGNSHKTLLDALTSTDISEVEFQEIISQSIALGNTVNPVSYTEDITTLIQDSIYGVDQISELVVNLKNFSRLDQARVAEANLNDCIDSALVVGRNVIKHKAEVVKDYDEQPTLYCNPSQLNQVFLNLLTNAAQAIDGRGEIRIATRSDRDFVYAEIEDTGRGMSEQTLAQIFDPFFTTKDVGHGTGLGLAISYQIIKQHRGEISATSREGQGSRFSIQLPRQAMELKAAV